MEEYGNIREGEKINVRWKVGDMLIRYIFLGEKYIKQKKTICSIHRPVEGI